MATSLSWDYSATAADIIQAALEDIKVAQAGESVDSDDSTVALRTLNYIVKQWQGQADMAPGLKVWTRQRLTLFLAKGQQRYLVGPASSDSRCTAQYGRTTVSADEASGQTVISITSNTDTTTYPGTTVTMTAADIIGIVQDDDTIHWTTISGTPTTTATITVATTAAASAGNYVYWFTSRAQRFPQLEFAYLREFDTSTFGKATDSPLQVYTDVQQYESLPDKTGNGDPVAILVEPQRLNTAITLSSQPDKVNKVINLTAFYPAEDYDATTNDIAFPQEFFAALEWELALRLVPKFDSAKWDDACQLNYNNAVPMARQVNPANSSAFFQPGLE